jgi:hypothetical protein
MFWEGEMPPWIAACRATVERHAPDVRLLNWQDFDRLRDRDRDVDLGRLHMAHRADFIRAFLLARFGGLWIDADCLVARPLDPVLAEAETADFLGYKERQGHVANNFMAARPGSALAEAYYRRVCDILRSGRKLEWLTLGSYALTEALDGCGRPWRRLGYELVQPICWSNPAAFFARRDAAGHAAEFNERSYCYMLSNNMVQGHQAAHPGSDLLAPDTFFSYLLARSAGAGGPVTPPRRSAVSTSNWQQIPFCVEAMLDVAPMRVLDVGIGFGRWGMLVREFCEEWKGRQYRENWRVHLEGIEAFPKNVEEYHHLFYDWIHIGDAAQVLGGLGQDWDLVVFGDVLEHWPKDVARRALERALDMARYVLVNIPLGERWERGPMNGNPYEAHLSAWTLDEFLALRPVRHATFTELWGRDYGAFLLSRHDPAGLRAA